MYRLHWNALHYLCVFCVENVLIASTYIALNALEILMTYINSVDIHSIIWYGWTALSLSFPKLFQIENQLNIKKVMSKNVCRVYVLCIDCIDIHSIECIRNLTTSIDSISTHSIGWILRKLWVEMHGCVLYRMCWHT